MARKAGLVKTKTIRQRRIDVYLPSMEARDAWSAAAKKRGQSVSQMVYDLVDTGLNDDSKDLEKDVRVHREENAELKERIALLNARIGDLEALKARLEDDLEEYRAEGWNQPIQRKKLDSRLVRVLSTAVTLDGKHKAVSEEELHKSLRIKPSDLDRLKALNEQLEVLELHELVRRAKKGWVWND